MRWAEFAEAVGFSDCQYLTGSEVNQLTRKPPNRDLQDRIRYFYTDYTRDENYFVIFKGKRIVAMTALEENPYAKGTFWVKFVSVESRSQGSGLARKMITQLYSWATQHGVKVEPSTFSEQGEQRIKSIFQQMDAAHPGVTVWSK